MDTNEDRATAAATKLLKGLEFEDGIAFEVLAGNPTSGNPRPMDPKLRQNPPPLNDLSKSSHKSTRQDTGKKHRSSSGQDAGNEHRSSTGQDAGKNIAVQMMDTI